MSTTAPPPERPAMPNWDRTTARSRECVRRMTEDMEANRRNPAVREAYELACDALGLPANPFQSIQIHMDAFAEMDEAHAEALAMHRLRESIGMDIQTIMGTDAPRNEMQHRYSTPWTDGGEAQVIAYNDEGDLCAIADFYEPLIAQYAIAAVNYCAARNMTLEQLTAPTPLTGTAQDKRVAEIREKYNCPVRPTT